MSSLSAVVLSRSLTKAIGPLAPGKAARVGPAAATTRRLAASIAAATARHALGRCILTVSVFMVLLPVCWDWIGARSVTCSWLVVLRPACPVGWVSGRRRQG